MRRSAALALSLALAVGSTPAALGQDEEWDPGSVSGTVTLSGWQSSPAEGNALTQTLLDFQATYPDVRVEYRPIPGDYPAAMAASFAARDVPDLFYVNAAYAQEWIDQGFLLPLDEYLERSGFETDPFFPGALSVFTGEDGSIYGLPKDINTIGMAYNTALVESPPETLEELVEAAEALQEEGGLQAPMCLNPGLDRGLAFIYAQGGELVSEDGSASAIQEDAAAEAVEWYLGLFEQGLGMTAGDLGAGWCGEALGRGDVAIIFEGGWLDPYLQETFPDTEYDWATMPVGESGEPVTISFTVSYSIGADAQNPDQAFVLLSYLTGPEGMERWTEGGVALPSREDVPAPEGKEVLAEQSEYARPGSGFMAGFPQVESAFQNAMTNEIQTQSYDASQVVSATQAAIEAALGGS
jgi:multiple sugar transport system substrate-binding protein